MAYFSEVVTLKSMIDHIYGRNNIIKRTNRPHMFIKELEVNVKYFKKLLDKGAPPLTENHIKLFDTFRRNLLDGITYYRHLFSTVLNNFHSNKTEIFNQLDSQEEYIKEIYPAALYEESFSG